MEYKDYYQILGVGRDATQDQIKQAYRKLARKYHPDVSKEKDAEARFKDAGEAYEVLKDPEKRAAYDKFGANWRNGDHFEPPPNWDAGFEFTGAPGAEGLDGAEFSDFFEQLFGRAARAQHAQGRGGAQARGAPPPQRGRDHHASIELDLRDAYHGAQRMLTLVREGVIEAVDGSMVRVEADSICVHGDSPGAVAIARNIRQRFEQEGVQIASFVGAA